MRRLRSLTRPHGSTAAAPERALLLRAIHSDGDGRFCGYLKEVRDWEAVVAGARRHGLLGTLHKRVESDCRDGMPGEVRGRLRGLYLENLRRNLVLSRSLLHVLDVLGRAGVTALPLKGPTLAEAVYGDVGMRQFSDLDLLVRRRDVLCTREVLTSNGFRLVVPARAADETPLFTAECELIFAHEKLPLLLDVHWRSGPRFSYASLSAEELIERAGPASLLGRPVLSPAPADLFVVLCMHGATHCWDQLEHVSTLAQLTGEEGVIDWDEVLRRSAERGHLRRCLVGAILVRDLTATELPRQLAVAADADHVALQLASEAVRHLFDDRAVAPGGGVRGIVWQARALDSPAEAMRHLMDRAFLPGARDWDWVELPPRLRGLYYAVRPARMAVQYARRGPRL